MKKIMLVGKLNKTVQTLNDVLSRKFQIQVCAEPIEIVKGMFEIVKPDMVVVSVMELEDISTAVFDYLSSGAVLVPILVVGTQDGCGKYEKYYTGAKFSALVRPIKKSQLLEKCRVMLHLQEDFSEIQKEEEEEDKQNIKRILIVDDSALVLRNMKTMLGKKYLIGLATSGEQAIKLMQRDVPDLILLDYDMPGLDGKATLEKIREDEKLKDIPVVFLTGVADRKHIAAVLELNPAGYFLKPADRDKLLAAIDDIFKGKHLEIPEIWDDSELI